MTWRLKGRQHILLAFAYWRRTRRVHQMTHYDTIRRFLDFIQACDTTGNGVPDVGCTNTIDDASPAIQYGREQVYLAVKALAALRCGAELLRSAGLLHVDEYLEQAEQIRLSLDTRGWLGDHYAVTLDPSAEGLLDPWSRQPLHGTLPGWDACHIYTANTLAMLDMLGCDLELDDERIAQDIITTQRRTLTRYGCTHRLPRGRNGVTTVDGVAVGSVPLTGGDERAARHRSCLPGIDLLAMAERYWDWQATTNARDVRLFLRPLGAIICVFTRAGWPSGATLTPPPACAATRFQGYAKPTPCARQRACRCWRWRIGRDALSIMKPERHHPDERPRGGLILP